jgi:hypothetical protein
MSHAFVKEEDDQWLDSIPPTLNALINYLTRENNGIRAFEKTSYTDEKTGKTVHLMSNGLYYSIDENSHWFMLD